jgi:hypothetical protein
MPKRLTAAELGDDGPLNPDLESRRVLIEVEIAYPGSGVSDLVVGTEVVKVRNSALRQAAIQAEMKEPTLPKAHKPVAYLRDLDGTGSLHVCAKGDPDAIPVYEQ